MQQYKFDDGALVLVVNSINQFFIGKWKAAGTGGSLRPALGNPLALMISPDQRGQANVQLVPLGIPLFTPSEIKEITLPLDTVAVKLAPSEIRSAYSQFVLTGAFK